MAIQSELWSINALSTELGIDRRTLAKRLNDLSPAKQKKFKNRTEKLWRLKDVIAHLNEPEHTKSANEKQSEAALDIVKNFAGDKLIPDILNSATFVNILVNGVAEDLKISKEQALVAYKYASLAMIYAVAELFGDDRMSFHINEDSIIAQHSRGELAFLG